MSQDSAQEITRKAKSNLAFALGILPGDQRADLTTFYAFCRSIDDLADDEGIPEAQRREALATWKQGLIDGFESPTELQREMVGVREHHRIPNDLLIAVIEGCEADLETTRYQNQDKLDDYIWKVACAVGLVCIRLFGCTRPESAAYAEALGRALQLTNILRDVGEDLARDRIYLPLDDLRQFDYSEDDLAARVHDERFIQLMEYQAARAEDFFEEAELNLTGEDRHALKPALIMAGIYRRLLDEMRGDGFQVFDKRYRISRAGKLLIGLKHLF